MIPGNANPLLLATAAAAAAGDVATKSLRFNSGDSAYLDKTFSSASNRRTWTWAGWVKRCKSGSTHCLFFAGTSNNTLTRIIFDSDGLNLQQYVSNSQVMRVLTNAVLRDPSAWYHIVVAVDTTQATASDRVNIYINGVLQDSFASETYPSENLDTYVSNSNKHSIGVEDAPGGSKSYFLDGYLADVYFIDGSQLDATSFGAYDSNGVWQAAAYSGTFGTNGFHLAFDDASSNAALGTDSSGNGNTFTVNNLIAAQFSPTATVVGDPTSSTDNPFGSGNGYSVLFDGNDSIRFSGPGLLTGDVTIECFLKIDSSGQSGYRRAFSTNEAVYSSEQSMIRRKNTGAFQFYFGDGTAEETDDTVDTNTWHHAAITYDQSASAVSYYVDGTRVGTDTYSGTVRITEMVVAGGMTNENWIGNISNCRITKQVLYSGTSYTVPTSTLTTTSQGATASNVVMLCCHQSSTTAVEGSFSAASDTDCLFDVPTNGDQSDTGAGGEVSGNYATFNPLSDGLGCTVSEGNLQLSGSATSSARINGTIGVSSGKWYFEVTYTATDSYTLAGVGQDDITNQYPGQDAKSYAFDFFQGKKYNNGSQTTYGSTLSAGDVFMCALDLDNNKIFFGKNGTFFDSSNPASGANPAYTVTAGTYHIVGRLNPSGFASGNAIIDLNAGQRAYAYSAPSGFKSWNTTNLPTPTIADGSAYFDTLIWTGANGGTTRSFTGLSFSPSFVWTKVRNFGYNHQIYDVVRGAGNNKSLASNDTSSEPNGNPAAYGYLSSFDSAGFTFTKGTATGDPPGNAYFDQVIGSAATYVGWCWDAGSSTVSNTNGSITTSVRASATSGFSIVSWTGTGATGSIGHGLNSKPQIVISKNRTDSSTPWVVDIIDVLSSGTNYMLLNSTQAAGSGGSTADNSVVNILQYNDRNGSGDAMIAYCFTSVDQYSRVGVYTGNGSADGPFVYTGFRPRWILFKRTSATNNWFILDTARDSYNALTDYLSPDSSNAEATASNIADALSNGFKVRGGSTYYGFNGSGDSYLYYAVAENPFQANGGLAR